jgi:hypothetical protein
MNHEPEAGNVGANVPNTASNVEPNQFVSSQNGILTPSDGTQPVPPQNTIPPHEPPYTTTTTTPKKAFGFTVPGLGSLQQDDFKAFAQACIKSLTSPVSSTYQAEASNASWLRILLGLAVIGILAAIVVPLRINSTIGSFFSGTSLVSFSGLPFSAIIGLAIVAIIGVFSCFFVGASLLLLMSLLLGGKGEGRDYLTHCYLLVLSYVPIRIVAMLLLLVVPIGSIQLVWWLQIFVQLFFASIAIQVAHLMDPNKAKIAAFVPAAIILLLDIIF